MQLYAAYAEGCDLREISTIIGAEALGDRDKVYLGNADRFENEFIRQGEFTKRRVEDTLNLGWTLFSVLPEEDLKLISEELIKKYHPKYVEGR
jgi:V/A-type H+-transporting ATPase subunit B